MTRIRGRRFSRRLAPIVAGLITCGAAASASADDLAYALRSTPGVFIATPSGSPLQLHPYTPVSIHAANLDGNGRDDLVIDFGPGDGVWVAMNQVTWSQLLPQTASAIAVGDLDGNESDEIVLDLPGAGVWVWRNNESWVALHPANARHLATGNINGSGGKELILDFAGFGIWVLDSAAGSWTQIHALSVSDMLTADLDGGGQDDVVLNFPGAGLWAWCDNHSWVPLHPFNPQHVAAGDRDGNGFADLAIDFGSAWGVWLYSNGSTWTPVHPLAAEDLLWIERSGNGGDELLVDFGATWGVWQMRDDGSWTQFSADSSGLMTAGRLLPSGTVSFSSLVPLNTAFTAPYVESDITVTPASGAWLKYGYGRPGPAAVFLGPTYQQPSVSASVAVTAGGAAFRFASVDLYSSVTRIPWSFVGYRSGMVAFTATATQGNTLGNYVTVSNPNANEWIDQLVITLTQPMNTTCPTCNGNPMGIDNIVIR